MRGLLVDYPATRLYRWIEHPLSVLFFIGLIGILSGTVISAQESENDSPEQLVKLGMSTALSGPAEYLGQNVRRGVEVAMAEFQASGKRSVKLYVLDDGYEPNRTIPNMRKLIVNDQVHAIIGNVGTPTSVVSLPIIRAENICFFGAYTGAGILRRDPPDSQVFNYRASYAQETAAMVYGLVNEGDIPPTGIAIFTQRDAYGDAGYSGAIEALRAHGLAQTSKLIHARYERNSLCVEQAVAQMLLADTIPQAIIMVGSYAPCAKFIKLTKDSGINPIFLNVSFVGTEPLIQALGAYGEGVIITQIVPHPLSDLPVVQAYRQAMQKHAPDASLNFGSLEGYIDMVIFYRALLSIKGQVTRQNIIDAFGNMGTFDMGLDVPLSFSVDDHQASDRVWPTIIRQQQAQPLNWSELSRIKPVQDVGVQDE